MSPILFTVPLLSKVIDDWCEARSMLPLEVVVEKIHLCFRRSHVWSHNTLSVLAGVMLSGCIWVNLDFLTSAVRSAVSCSGILYSGHGRTNTA